MKEESGNIIWSNTSIITMMFCPCAGWTLAEGGQMVQGATGYLIDENGYYILEDGRRVSDEIIIESRYGEKDIRIGNKEVSEGLFEIMNARSLLPIKTVYNDARQLLDRYRYYMPLVVQQAFQINACYAKPNGIQNPLALGSNAKFYSIGADETGIPIVVTQVGEDGPDKKKLVIAGPHGDERNAQRLIMSAQKYFIDKDLPADTVLYFIPCLSPTMCFADARGIPLVDEVGNKLPLPEAKSRITIPYLHNLIASQVPKDPRFPNERELLRKLIQDQLDSTDPKYGIDANRDVKFDLGSSKRFAEFIKSITGIDLRLGIKLSDKSGQNVTVFMMHGYDNSKVPGRKPGDITPIGCVYGQYKLDDNKPGTGLITPMILQYIDMMTQCLFGYINDASIDAANRIDANKKYFYLNDNNIDKFNGEWIRHLYGNRGELGILAFDIELGNTYNEWIRGSHNSYNYNKIGNILPFFDPNEPGFFVPETLRITIQDIESDASNNDKKSKREYMTTSFYKFIEDFYDKMKTIDSDL